MVMISMDTKLSMAEKMQNFNGALYEEGSSNTNEDKGSYSLGYQAYPQNLYLCPPYLPDYQVALQNHYYQIENHLYPMSGYYVPDDILYQYPVFYSLAQLPQPELTKQEFDFFLVIDFEATCDEEKNPQPYPQEIIEFPAVLVNSTTGNLEGNFQVYVRPTHNQQLSDFCKELTGIQQEQVDKGVVLSAALLQHDKWLEEKGVKTSNFVVVTWSNWDCQVMLESECRFKSIRKPPYFDRWINLRVPFHKVFGEGIRCNLKEAVELAGLTWEGRAHCGLDDARNTAHLLTNLMQRGVQFAVTNTLTRHPTKVSSQVKAQVAAPLPQISQIQAKEVYCFCGVKCQKLKPTTASYDLYCCGNLSPTGGVSCTFSQWAI